MHIKLHNYKRNNTKFQLLLCLHPVFGPNNEYKYQVGLQVEFNEDKDLYKYLAECDNFMRIIPNTLDSRPCQGYDNVEAQVDATFEKISNQIITMQFNTTNFRTPDNFEDPYAGIKREVFTVDMTNAMTSNNCIAGMASGAENMTQQRERSSLVL